MEIEAEFIAVTNNNPSGDGSFAAALAAARSGDTISLNAISGQTITLTGPLPSLMSFSFIEIQNSGAPVIVDGTSAGVVDGVILGPYSVMRAVRLRNFQKSGVVVAGEGCTLNNVSTTNNKENGLTVNAGAHNTRVNALTSSDNTRHGVFVVSVENFQIGDQSRILNNGLDGIHLSQTTKSAVGYRKVVYESSRNFGPPRGSEPHEVISGNGVGVGPTSPFGVGIRITGGGSNVVTSSYVGVNAEGTQVQRNTRAAIAVINSSNNIIGGAYPGTGNLVSARFGTNSPGVLLQADSGQTTTGNQIIGNFIGTNATGTAIIQGAQDGSGPGGGVLIYGASGNIIGGNRLTGPFEFPSGRSNLISGNAAGVDIVSSLRRAQNNQVLGNFIGTNAAGTAFLKNDDYPVGLQDAGSGNIIGGPFAGDGNVLVGGKFDGFSSNPGVLIFSTPGPEGGPGTLVQGNFIGTDLTGTLNLGNVGAGIENLHSSNGTFMDNVIRFNGGAGVKIDGTATSAINNKIVANQISNNTGKGIDLGGPANDAGDVDTGPNNGQNSPIIGSCTTQNGVTSGAGTCSGKANTALEVHFASNLPGEMQGADPCGSVSVMTDPAGLCTFGANLPPVPAGHTITATLTDPAGNTSEYSPAAVVTGATGSADLYYAGLNYVYGDDSTAVSGFEVTVRNDGPDDATGVVFAGSFVMSFGEANITMVTSDRGNVTQNGNSFTVNIGTLPNEERANIVIHVLLDPDSLVGLGNASFTITAVTPDPRPSNNKSHAIYRRFPDFDIPFDIKLDEPPRFLNVPAILSAPNGINQAITGGIPITLPEPSTEIVVVDFETVDGTAMAGQDYGAVAGTLIFPPGTTTQNIPITIFGDDTLEGDETFRIKLSNPLNATLGKTELLAVIAANDGGVSIPNQLANISTRMAVGTDPNVLIGGFIIPASSQSTDVKKVILRAIGPSLPFNGILANPTLSLFDGTGAQIGANDNWRTTQIGGVITSDNVAAIEASSIPPTHDNESAMVVDLPAGSYTAIVRGAGDTTGIAVVEAYDLDTPGPLRLANIATRGFVDTGDNVMIGGTITLGSGEQNILVRAIGPSLGAAGVAGSLQNPTLELRDGNGGLVASNDDWRSDQEAEIIATTIPPSQNAESAILSSLPPGSYTAIVRGQGGTTGVGLVEFYRLP